jgi:hypothetical protein
MLTLKTASVLLPCDLEECLAALREHPCDYLLLDNDECDDENRRPPPSAGRSIRPSTPRSFCR